ncbi:MAG: hypothetical protein J5494_02755 [Candidatus Methanomethylophilaceae archaeon]|nr:hypothetical protein [Candidatus Methanomethylophilaceae archaeon]
MSRPKRFNSILRYDFMDKSMIPIMAAIAAIAVAGAVLALYGEENDGPPPAYPSDQNQRLIFESDTLTLPEGVSYKPRITDASGNPCVPEVLKSSDESVCGTDQTPNGWFIYPEKPGTCRITAESGDLSGSFKLTVKLSSSLFDTQHLILHPGETANAEARDLIYKCSTSDPSVCAASVSLDEKSCAVKALACGECFIIAYEDAMVSKCKVTVIKKEVSPLDPEGSLLNTDGMLLASGRSGTILAGKEAEWSVSDSTVCSISVSKDRKECIVTALKAGTCTVTAVSGESSGSCSITVFGFGAPADIPGAPVPGESYVPLIVALTPGSLRTIEAPPGMIPLVCTSSDPSVCAIIIDHSTGTVAAIAKSTGACDLTVTYGSLSLTVPVVVVV